MIEVPLWCTRCGARAVVFVLWYRDTSQTLIPLGPPKDPTGVPRGFSQERSVFGAIFVLIFKNVPPIVFRERS
jgi:hypothetical protein